MKTLGVVGGLGPESTIEYYRLLVSRYRGRVSDGSYPSLLIDSIDVGRVLSFAGEKKLDELCEYLLSSLNRLHSGGADFAIMAANTPHVVFDQLAERTSLPLISIVQAACDYAQNLGLKRLGLLGTRSTMQTGFYQEVFGRADVAVSIPEPDDQNYVHEKYVSELLKGVFLPETRHGMLQIVKAMKDRDGIDGVILGGTELPLLLREEAAFGLPLLDTTRIHVNAALDQMLS
jgi:aspartate racemase